MWHSNHQGWLLISTDISPKKTGHLGLMDYAEIWLKFLSPSSLSSIQTFTLKRTTMKSSLLWDLIMVEIISGLPILARTTAFMQNSFPSVTCPPSDETAAWNVTANGKYCCFCNCLSWVNQLFLSPGQLPKTAIVIILDFVYILLSQHFHCSQKSDYKWTL